MINLNNNEKRNYIIILIALAVLSSCTNTKKGTLKEEVKSKDEVITSTKVHTPENLDHDSSKAQKHNYILSGINYSFSNDTLCQTISVKEINRNGKDDIPAKLKFMLKLHDKQHKYADKTFEGIAQLTRSEESFSDNSDKNGGDYFAADYNFKTTDYEIQIRLDIQNYEACVVLITTNRPDIVVGGYSSYLKEFPNDGVMIKGECK